MTDIFRVSKEVDSTYAVQVVDVPYLGNRNIAAQKGTFTVVYSLKKYDQTDEYDSTPVEVAMKAIFDETQHTDLHNDVFNFGEALPLTKITIPIDQASHLLMELNAVGYNSSRIYPGYYGCRETLIEQAEYTMNQ